MQDLLGEVHDLDVLRSEILKNCLDISPDAVSPCVEKIEVERKDRLNAFRSMTAQNGSVWLTWRAGFQWGHTLKPASPVGQGIA